MTMRARRSGVVPAFWKPRTSQWWDGLRQACFPGAVGYGTDTAGGRFGQVVKVTNLDPTGLGSLHEALVNTSGARFIVPEVSGTIVNTAAGDLVWAMADGNVTFAGYAAPWPGIQLRGVKLVPNASNLVFQHLTIRAGDDPNGRTGLWAGDWDCVQASGATTNIVFDHCTFMWGIDETFSLFSPNVGGLDNVTLSNSIVAEGLYDTGFHSDGGPHSTGVLFGTETRSVSMFDCLLMSNDFRNPLMQSGGTGLIGDNMIYNPGQIVKCPNLRQGGVQFPRNPHFVSIVGNVGRSGPSSAAGGVGIQLHGTMDDASEIYVNDNDMETALSNGNPPSILVGAPPVALPTGWASRGSANVEAWILAHAGSRSEEGADTTVQRLRSELIAGTGSLKNSVAEAGGYPVYAENSRPLTIPANHDQLGASGFYSVLEETLLFPLLGSVEGKV